jgi:hypothetical protein
MLYADMAMNVGIDSGALTLNENGIAVQKQACVATLEDQEQCQVWESVLSTFILADNGTMVEPSSSTNASAVPDLEDDIILPCPSKASASIAACNLDPVMPICPQLNQKQTMAHNIITAHLLAHLRNENPTQKLMIIHGQGGTGKSALLNTILKTFAEKHASHSLAKTAMSGVAACLIGGQTLHSWAVLPIKHPQLDKWLTHPGREISWRQKKNVSGVLWLTIDKMSMMMTPQVTHLSQITSVVCSGQTAVNVSAPFRQLCLVLSGDLHQIPPVASTKKPYTTHRLQTIFLHSAEVYMNNSTLSLSLTSKCIYKTKIGKPSLNMHRPEIAQKLTYQN